MYLSIYHHDDFPTLVEILDSSGTRELSDMVDDHHSRQLSQHKKYFIYHAATAMLLSRDSLARFMPAAES